MYSITVPEVYLCLYNEENGIWIHKMKKGASNKMKGYREAYKKAFPYTIPVLTGYIFIGVAFGVMFAEKGYSIFMGCAYEYSCICRFRTVSCCEFFCSLEYQFSRLSL